TDNTGNGGTANPSADVSVNKTLVTAGPYLAGQSISYSLVVTNNGPSTATAINVSDTPTNLSITSVTGACTAFPCTIPSLTSGSTATITVNATIIAAGAFDNSATATGAENDPVPANNTDNTGNGGNASPSADVAINKTLLTAGPFTLGQVINYTLVVSNNGPSTATAINVTDTPTNLAITSVTGACAALPCTIASLTSGSSATLNVAATITAVGAFNNSATATGAESDPVPANNTDNTGNGGFVGPSPSLTLAKSASTPTYNTVGQVVNYSYVVTNTGNVLISGIAITDDKIPTVTCPVTTLAPNAGTTCTGSYTITLADLNAGSVTNNASVNGTPTAGSLSPATDSETVTAVQSPSMTVDKSNPTNADNDASGTVSINDVLTYVVTATNSGNITLTNVVVSDPQLTPTSNTCASVVPGATCVLTGTHLVTLADVTAGSIVNTATGDSDQTAPVTDTVTTPTAALAIVANDDTG
ncbi:DUF11 domain-containing protein, partial [Arenimonas oryziterrae]